MDSSDYFEFYHLFFQFQWKSGIIPFQFEEVLLIWISLWTNCANESIKHSVIFQASWFLVFVLITSTLFLFEFKADEMVRSWTEWVHLEYFISQLFGQPDSSQKTETRRKQLTIIFQSFLYLIRFGSSGLVAMFWLHPHFPIFLYSFAFEKELTQKYSILEAFLLKLGFALFECSFLLYILGIYTLGFILLPIIALSLSNCVEKLEEVRRRGTEETEKVLIVYNRLERLFSRLDRNYQWIILLEELVSLIAISVFTYALICFTGSLFQTLFFLIVVSFFVGIMALLYYPVAVLNLKSRKFLRLLRKRTIGRQERRLLVTCKPLVIQPLRLHSIQFRTILEYMTLVTNYVVLCICMMMTLWSSRLIYLSDFCVTLVSLTHVNYPHFMFLLLLLDKEVEVFIS